MEEYDCAYAEAAQREAEKEAHFDQMRHEAEIEALEPEGNGPTCFSCGEQMTLAPSEIVYECECGYWCYSSS